MKKLLFILLITNLGLSYNLIAQPKNDEDGNGGKKELRFIDDIEINRKNTKITSASSKKSNSSIKIIPIIEKVPVKSIEIEKSTALQFKYAQRLDVEVESLKNKKLYQFIEEWLSTRYEFGGTDKLGIDCSSFSGRLEKDIYDFNLPRNARQQYRSCDKISIADAKEGDLVFFNTRGGISHVGVYLANGYFVHASTSLGVTISNLTEEYYNRRFISAGRFSPTAAEKLDQLNEIDEAFDGDISNNSVVIEKSSKLQFKYAQLLDVEVENLTNKKLYQFIEEWLNTPYEMGGEDKSGIDCSSFSGKLEKDIYDLDIPRNARQQYRASKKINIENAKEGDLLFFNTSRGVSHVGVYLANGYFVHASTSSGVIISNLNEEYYSNRFNSAGRIVNE